MTAMGLPGFTRTDREYIQEYVKVAEPIARALDMVQGEKQAYFGTLLPTIFVARDKLKELIDGHELRYCKELAKALLRGLEKRFKPTMLDEKCQLATAFHPIFRNLGWLPTEKHEIMKKNMETLVALELKKIAEKCPITSADVTHNIGEAEVTSSSTTGAVPGVPDYYSKLLGTISARGRRDIYEVNAKKIVETWTGTPVSSTLLDSDFLREHCLIELFIKYNTPVPSSAGVERLFSQGGDILRPKRSSLKDDRFNMLMFMRGNRHHWDTYKEECHK